MLRFCCVFFLILFDAELAKAINRRGMANILSKDPKFNKVIKTYWNNAKTVFKSENDVPKDLFGNGQLVNYTDLEETDVAIQSFAPIYEKRIQKNGLRFFQAIGEYLQKKLYLTKDQVTLVIKKNAKRYNAKVRSHFNFLLRDKLYNDYERHFVLLDMVNFGNSQMNNVAMSLVHDLVRVKPGYTGGKLDVTAAIFNFNLEGKTQELNYICKMMQVCRTYPGYSDYFASTLGYVMKLYNRKFIYVVMKSLKILNSKKDFLKTILNNDIIAWFSNKTKRVFIVDIDKTRTVVSGLRSALTWRPRMLNFTEEPEKDKEKALAVLIDIVDRAFDKYDSEALFNQFYEVTASIRKWGSNLSNEIASVLRSIMDFFEKTLSSELNDLAKEEMKTLADIVFKGKSDNEFMARYLMRTGSRFLKGNLNNAATVSV